MTAAALVVLASALVFVSASCWLKRADDRDHDGPRETTRQWLGLEEGEEL
jgi:hypothetical protein